MAAPLSDNLATRRAQLAQLKDPTVPDLSLSGKAPTVDLSKAGVAANAPSPALSMNDTPPMYQPPVSTVVPTDQQKYGGTQVPGAAGQKNVGVDGYTTGKDAYKLGSVAQAGTPEEAVKKINEDQVKTTNESKAIPDPAVRDGYQTPGQATAGLVEPTPAKGPIDTYLDYLTSFNDKMNTTNFSATQTQDELMKNAGVENDQNQLNGLDAEERQIVANRNARVAAQANQTIPGSVYAGRVSEIEKQENVRLEAIANEKQTLVNQLNTKNNMIGMIMKNKEYDYESAQNLYKTQYAQAIQGINLFRDLRNDQLREQEAADNKVAAEAKAKADAIEKDRTDARANLNIYYGYIADGSLDVNNMSEAQQVEVAKNEVRAGMPIGTFTNLANKFKGQDLKGQPNDIYDANGNRYMQFVMQDKKTGAVSVYTQAATPDYREVQKIDKSTLALAADQQGLTKGALDITKAKQDIVKGNYDIVAAQLGITTKELDNQLKQADVNNIPIDQALKQLDAQQKIAAGYESTQPGAFDRPSAGVSGEFGAQYGKRADGSNIEATASGKNVGTDIRVGPGTKVAIPSGTWKVDTVLNNHKIYGNSVLVRNTETGETLRLSHLESADVQPGETIQGGTVIGKSGATGNVTGPHLDVEYKTAKGQLADLRGSAYSDFYLGGKKVVPAKSATEKTAETEQKLIKNVYSSFTDPSIQGKDGKVSPASYKEIKRKWIASGKEPKEFDQKFYEYVNPTNHKAYGLDSSVENNVSWDDEVASFQDKQKKDLTIYDMMQ